MGDPPSDEDGGQGQRKASGSSKGRRAVREAVGAAEPARVVELRPGAPAGDGAAPSGGGVSGGAGDDRPRTIDLADEWNTALQFVSEDFIVGGYRTLNRYRGDIYRYDGASHRRIGEEEVGSYLYRKVSASATFAKGGEIVPCRPTARKTGALLHAAKHAVLIPDGLEVPCWLPSADPKQRARPESATDIWAVQNGLLHLPSGRLLPPTPAFFGLHPSPVVWSDAPAAPARFLSFLREAFGDDDQAVSILRQAFGYSISLDTSAQKIFGLIGPPRSGKSTLLRLLTELVGAENVCSPTLSSLGDRFGLEPLIGKSIATIVDARLGLASSHAEIIQTLLRISGEDRVGVARKYQGEWQGQLRTRLWLAANELPTFGDTSNALATRMIVIPMNRSFVGEEDPELLRKLVDELPGIAGWAVEGLIELRERGYFVQPDSGRQALAGMREVASETANFVAQSCRIEPGEEIESAVLFLAYTRWRQDQALETRVSQPLFGKRLREVCPSVKVEQRRQFGARTRFYRGIRLLRPNEDAGAV